MLRYNRIILLSQILKFCLINIGSKGRGIRGEGVKVVALPTILTMIVACNVFHHPSSYFCHQTIGPLVKTSHYDISYDFTNLHPYTLYHIYIACSRSRRSERDDRGQFIGPFSAMTMEEGMMVCYSYSYSYY